MFASELAKEINGRLIGPGDPELKAIRPIGEAGEGDLAFLHNVKYKKILAETGASCVVLSEASLHDEHGYAVIIHDNPHQAMAVAVDLLYPGAEYQPGIHPSAVVDLSATIGEGVYIGPNAYIGGGCVIGDDSIVESGCNLMSDVHLGAKSHLYPNVTIYPKSWLGKNCIIHAGTVLGSDGFGFAPSEDGILKVKQVGKLVIEADVEIGASCTIDRGTFTETRIGRGTKLDNLVHIAHNCKLGENCLIAAQSGLAGSTELGDRVIVAGQVGFAGHQVIGDDCIFFAKSGINGDIEAGSQYFGYPAKPRMQAHRENAYIARLGELFKKVKELKRKLEVTDDNNK